MLSRPTTNERIPIGIQSFVSENLKNDCYHLVLNAFHESGLSQSELAARLGKDKALLNRQLSTPSNWTLETVARLLFAINGSLVVLATSDPDRPAVANYTQPSWFNGNIPPITTSTAGTLHAIVTFVPASPRVSQIGNVFSRNSPPVKHEVKQFNRIAAE